MKYSKLQLWERFQRYYTVYPTIGLALDLSRMRFDDGFFAQMDTRIQNAFEEMNALEAGAIANPDEGRMVGHYWLRNPILAPTELIRKEIEETVTRIETFAKQVHEGIIQGQGGVFKNLLLIGIGGSALGPQFVANALGHPKRDKLAPFFIDNTDPDGIQRVLTTVGDDLGRTICIVISKSGGTKETRNGMLEAKAVYEASGLNFGEHCVAITRVGSLLHEVALKDKWLTSFPMWDWVGGRTSELSAVGLVPAALQGIDIQLILSGAKACDELTRRTDVLTNPSAQLALAWYFSGDGRGLKDMVVIPYKDRLELLPRYLQQLVMESLGKEMDRDGTIVNQGLNVFGNKGSTDQHSYIQQLRDGINNFFVTFLEVLSDGESSNLEVDENLTSSDYLAGFYLGTRQALFENGRDSLTVIVQEISPSTIGALIALFERAVGFYATLANVNAYHQPGVEAGKKAAESILGLQKKIFDLLSEAQGEAMACTDIANRIGNPDEVEHVFKICERLSTNQKTGVTKTAALNPFGTKFKIY